METVSAVTILKPYVAVAAAEVAQSQSEEVVVPSGV